MSFCSTLGASGLIVNNLSQTVVYRSLRMKRNKKISLFPGVCGYLFGEIAFEFQSIGSCSRAAKFCLKPVMSIISIISRYEFLTKIDKQKFRYQNLANFILRTKYCERKS